MFEQEALWIFEDMADELDIPFAFPADGCYARSQMMIQRISDRYGIKPDSIQQITIMGNLNIQTEFIYPNSREYPEWVNHDETARWSWHVAPMVVVVTEERGGIGMVIDPSLMDGPADISDWKAMMNDPDASLEFENRYWYNPLQTNVGESEALGRSRTVLERYLDYCRNAGYCE